MEILLLNSNSDNTNKGFETYMESLIQYLKEKSFEVTRINLGDLKLNHCIGCWDCWVKTPGVCRHKDDASLVYKAYLSSDIVIFASPLVAGFVNALMKKMNDRLIPLLHPYIDLVHGECHHKKRYGKYPRIGLLLQTEQDTDEEDLAIVRDIYKRFALNFQTDLIFVNTIQDNYEDFAYALEGI